MLGENCPATGEVPLMQHPVSGRKFRSPRASTRTRWSRRREADEEDDEYALVAPPAAPSPSAAPAPAADDDDFDALAPLSKADEARAADRKQSDEWCAAMSALMLKGWKMLGDNCPITGRVPLMQHPTNERKFSVAANKYLDEMPPHRRRQPAEAGSAPPPPRPPPAPTTTALAVAPAPAPAPRAPPRACTPPPPPAAPPRRSRRRAGRSCASSTRRWRRWRRRRRRRAPRRRRRQVRRRARRDRELALKA